MNVIEYIIKTTFKGEGIKNAEESLNDLKSKAETASEDIDSAMSGSLKGVEEQFGKAAEEADEIAKEAEKIGKNLDKASQPAGDIVGRITEGVSVMAVWAIGIEAVVKIWEKMKEAVDKVWESVKNLTAENQKVTASSFGRINDAFGKAARENGLGDYAEDLARKTAREMRNAEYRKNAAAIDNEQAYAVAGVTDKAKLAAINEEYRLRRENLKFEKEAADIEDRIADNELSITRNKRDQEQLDRRIAAQQKAIEGAKAMRNGVGDVDMDDVAEGYARLMHFVDDEAAKVDSKAYDEMIKKAKKDMESIEYDKRRLATQTADLESKRSTFETQKYELLLKRQTAEQRRTNGELARDANAGMEQAEAAAKAKADAEKKARADAIAAKKAEIAAQKEDLVEVKKTGAEKQAQYKAEIAHLDKQIAAAKELAKSQIPESTAAIRAERNWRKHGGYGGGGVGEDGIAGTWDDPKAQKKYDRLMEKYNRMYNNGLNTMGGAMSKSQLELLSRMKNARDAAKQAQQLAQQRDALEQAAWKAQVAMSADVSKMEGNLANLAQDLATLMRAQ